MNTTGPQPIGDHAVVIGASMAGLLAARALSDHYARVTIIERDTLPAMGEGRRAVPQGRHAHALLASGARAIESLLPGITGELIESGAVLCESTREIRMVIAGHPITRDARAADVMLASRPLIEGQVRRRVLAICNVSVRERCDALALLTTQGNHRVTGVRLQGQSPDGAEESLMADLVVAATGRDARVATMLEALGYERPKEDHLDVDIHYVSRRIRVRPGALGPDRGVLIGAQPGQPRGLMLVEQEDHWILTMFGYGPAHRPPMDEDGYLAFVGSVAPSDVLEAIRQAELLTDLTTHGFPASLRRRYDRIKRFPDGLLVVGDAICSFNPLYGQGMSIAALEALAMRECLLRGEQRLARRFLRAAGKIIDQAWEMAVGGDLALPEVPGHRSVVLRVSNAYAELILRAAEHDPIVAAAFSDVSDLVAPPQLILRPAFAWRVLRESRGWTQAASDPIPSVAHQPLVLELSRRATKSGRTAR